MSGEHWMTQEERGLWAASKRAAADKAPEAAPEAAGKAAAKKPSQAKLNAGLLEACSDGDLAEIGSLLAQGANPNARTRANPGHTGLDLALHRAHDGAALAVMRAGGWPAPSRWRQNDSDAFDKAVGEGAFPPAIRAALAAKALELFAGHAMRWDALAQARDWCCADVLDPQLTAMAMERERFSLALDAVKKGIALPSEAWSTGLAQKLSWRRSGMMDHPERSSLLALLAQPLGASSMGSQFTQALHAACAQGDDAELAAAMLDAGMRPSQDWTILRLTSYGHPINEEGNRPHAMVMAAEHQGGRLFEFYKKCAPALQALLDAPPNPLSLPAVPIGRLMEMMELGVGLERAASDGRGLAHVWASLDSEPRDGWATLAKKAPGAFEMRDAQGRTGAQAMAEKLRGAARDEFLASISRIEVREIKREIATPNSKLASGPRQRL